jgi:peptide deformylase
VAKEAGQVRTEELDAGAEVRRRLALSQIRQYPDPALRMEGRPVESFDDELAQLVARLSTLMVEANGVGLAATQIGILRRVAAIQQDDDVVALVNPSIVERSNESAVDDEGCLSLQGVLVPVERSCRVTVEARDPSGGELRLELEGLPARVVQHELDHLDGVLILDRTTDEARREALGTLRPQPVLTLG